MLLGAAYREAAGAPQNDGVLRGNIEPRIVTRPRRELTPETSRGFAVIAFAANVLRVRLFPWQKALLIRLLELNPDRTLRFRKALVIVGRQNGKTTVAGVLAAYWLWVDSKRWPDQVPVKDFLIVGSADKLDVAMKPWSQVRAWGAPDDPKVGVFPERVPALQAGTRRPGMVNGQLEMSTVDRAKYLPRTFEGARGHSAARALVDELRKHEKPEEWAAIEKTTSGTFDSMIVAFSNAGTERSVVLKRIRDEATRLVDDDSPEWFIAEWSAKPSAKLTDPAAFQASNPSAGYLPGMTIEGLVRAAASAVDEAVERTEVLGQWVKSMVVTPFIRPAGWRALHRPVGEVRPVPGERTVWGFDVSETRATSWLAAATRLVDGRVFATVRVAKGGSAWILEDLDRLARLSGHDEVVIQAKGCPAMEWIKPLRKAGLTVHALEGSEFALACGRLRDHVRDRDLVLVEQPGVDATVAGVVGAQYADNQAIARAKSKPVDASGMISLALALYGLEVVEPPVKTVTPGPPAPAAVLTEVEAAPTGMGGLLNLATVHF